MGHSRDDKAKSHERIVEIAAARIRESGTAAPGVAEIMQTAGLTHGGFYKHFGSRDELIAEAADRTFADSERAFLSLTEGAADPLGTFVDWYLSREHCENPAAGCGIVALGADAPRTGDRVRAAYTEQVRSYIAHLEEVLGAGGDPEAETRRRAVVTLSALVGAVLVARAVDDPGLADEILGSVRAAVTSGA
jgi:TetR/AcrR family transcriptional regulator, transcriptional repressor for nem operon